MRIRLVLQCFVSKSAFFFTLPNARTTRYNNSYNVFACPQGPTVTGRAGVFLANTMKFDVIISFAIAQHNDVRNDQIKKCNIIIYNATRVEIKSVF